MFTWHMVQFNTGHHHIQQVAHDVAGQIVMLPAHLSITSSHTQAHTLLSPVLLCCTPLACSHCLKQQPSHPAVDLFSLTPATALAFEACTLRDTTESGFDSTLVAHSKLLPSLITGQPAISQQRLGITIHLYKTESPSHPWANSAIHFNKDAPLWKRAVDDRKKMADEDKWSETWTESINVCISPFVSVI